jgi:hypothetical protein
MATNGVSTIDDFRNAARADRQSRAEAVRLPSGLIAKLVRPSPLELMLFTGQLPQSLAARISPADATGTPSAGLQEVVKLAQRLLEQVRFIFESPRVPDEAKPGIDIPVSDVEYALRWARGEIVGVHGHAPAGGDGEAVPASRGDLAEFRGERGGAEATPAAGPSGGDVRLPTE